MRRERNVSVIVLLLVFCMTITLIFNTSSMMIIDDESVPMASVNSKAIFYVTTANDGLFSKNSKIGIGEIRKIQSVSDDVVTVEEAIIMKPDTSAFLASDEDIEWFSAYAGLGCYRVVGRVVKVENYNDESIANDILVSGVYDTVQDMANASLQIGDEVSTLGYYTSYDNGGGSYNISSEIQNGGLGTITLSNGLFANLVTESDSINIKHLGAYGDGVHDDAAIINKALNSGRANVYFPTGEYKCNSHIYMTTSNVTIEGNDSTIFTSNDFDAGYVEWFWNIQANNIRIDNLNIVARETNKPKYKTQLGIQYSDGVTITNCDFVIPDTVLSEVGLIQQEYSNIDLFTVWNNVTIDHCNLTDMAGAYAGVCIEIRDIYGGKCSGATFTNNNCYHNTKDEILTVFGLQATSRINSVVIANNSFYEYECPNYERNVAIALGYSDDFGIGANDVLFSNNFFEGWSNYEFFKVGDSTNVTVLDNTIKCHNDNSRYADLFFIRGKKTDNNVNFVNNNIQICDDGKNLFDGVAYGIVGFSNNIISCDVKVNEYAFSDTVILDDNDMKFLE